MELFYRKYGEGVPIIIVHGLYGASDNWVTIGRRLAEGFEVFIIDQRNHGRSPHSKSHNYQAMVGDLYEFLVKHNIDKAILLGHSMGGKTVMYFACQYPEKVNGLIVLDIAPKSYLQLSKKDISEISHYNILKAMKNVDFSIIQSREDVDDQLGITIKSAKLRRFLLKSIHKDIDDFFHWRLNVDALYRNIDEILNGMDTDFFDSADLISGFPVLFIRGSNSKYILDEDLDRIETIFPYAELKTIDNAGHWLHAEQPQGLVSLIVDFLT